MCAACAAQQHARIAREAAGFVAGTQLSKIRSTGSASDNASGYRGVYFDGKTNRYRARIKFRSKVMNLGSFERMEDAVKARQKAEEEIFGKFLETLDG